MRAKSGGRLAATAHHAKAIAAAQAAAKKKEVREKYGGSRDITAGKSGAFLGVGPPGACRAWAAGNDVGSRQRGQSLGVGALRH